MLSLKPNSHPLWTVGWLWVRFKSQDPYSFAGILCVRSETLGAPLRSRRKQLWPWCSALSTLGGFPAYPIWGTLLQCSEGLHSMTHIFNLNLSVSSALANWPSHSCPWHVPDWPASQSLCGSHPCWCPCLHAFMATLSVMITSFLESPTPRAPLSWSLL